MFTIFVFFIIITVIISAGCYTAADRRNREAGTVAGHPAAR